MPPKRPCSATKGSSVPARSQCSESQGWDPGICLFTSFPTNIQLARAHSNTQEDLVTFLLFQKPGWNSTNPKLNPKNSTPDATCCFSELKTLEEIHSTCYGFSSLRAPVCIWNCGSTSVSWVPGLTPHLKSCSSLCDSRRGLSPRRWQEAPVQQGELAPGQHLQRSLGAGGARRTPGLRGLRGGFPVLATQASCRPGAGGETART